MASPAKKASHDVGCEVKDAIERGDWTEVVRILSECSHRDSDIIITQVFLHCDDDQLDSVLTHLVKQGEWKAVDRVLHRGVSNARHRWAVEKCIKKAYNDDFIEYALYHCADDQLDSVLTHLVTRGEWKAVDGVLHRGVSNARHRWAVEECSKKAKSNDFIKYALPHCAGDQLDSVLTHLVTRGQWEAVDRVLHRGVSNARHRWAVEKCSKNTFNDDFIKYVLRHCAGDQLDSVLTHLVTRGQWKAVDRVLHRGVTNARHRWAVEKCSKNAYDDDFIEYALYHCAGDQLDSVLTHLVTRGQWKAADRVLHRGVSNTRHRWAVEVCSRYATSDDSIEYALPHCADDQLDSVLTHLVAQGKWKAADRVLHRGVTNARHRWAVEECSKEADSDDIIEYALPHCADDQLDSVLTHLVTRGEWKAVDRVLHRGVSNTRHRWAVEECSKEADSDDFTEYALHHCADNQLDSVLTHLVKQGEWKAVDRVLHRGVNNARHRWAVEECSKNAYDHFIEYALRHCAGDQLDSVLTHLVTRGEWEAVDRVLHRGVSNDRHRWAVEECSKKADSDDFIEYALRHCADDQLDSVLTHLVAQGEWKAVDVVLHRGVSNARHRWAVEECSKNAYNDYFIEFALYHCADDQLDSVLTPLVTRGQWKAVERVLHRGVCNARHRWAVEECSKNATSDDFIKYALPHCANVQFDFVLTHLIQRDLWEAVGKTLHQGMTTADDMWKTGTINQDKQQDSFLRYILPRDYTIVLPFLVEHGKQDLVGLVLDKVVASSLHQWVTGETRLPQGDEEASLNDVGSCHIDLMLTMRLFKAVRVVGEDGQARRSHLGLKEDLYEVLYMSLVHNVCVALCSDDKSVTNVNNPVDSCVPEIYHKIHSCMRNITVGCSVEAIIDQWNKQDSKLSSEPLGICKHSSSSTHVFFQFLRQFNLYYRNRRGENDDDILLTMFAVLPLFPELQSVALRVMLRHKRWDVISHACLSRVWEQDRWQLLKAAVKQRQWSVVSKWADHTLYDDQRVWALNEALNAKQWDVALLLADHGLTDIELMRAHYRVAKYADWDVVLRMFERGGDVAEIAERLGRMREAKRIPENVQRNIARTHIEALQLENKMRGKKSHKDLRKCCQERNWTLVLYSLVRCPSKTSHHMALSAAVKKKAWHVVIQLVRLGMDKAKRDSFFSRMMRRRQWGVCRALLEQGLSVQVCLDALPHLMEMNQWTLVARVMEHEVDDAVKQQVMLRAWERREGSVVWLCIKSLPAPLSVEEREALFQRAFSCEIWQVIKPLIEEKDETGIRHRDTALLEAIEQHQWDVVDHCQRHHADINMKDDDGHTPIHRAARKRDWEAVKELTVRDGDPNLLDRAGLSVLHRAIRAEQWVLVKLLIQFHGDIHQAAQRREGRHDIGTRTPLQMLIDARQGEVIESTLMWCPDQQKVVNNKGETVLHAVCLSGLPGALHHLIARKVDPLAATDTGHTALCYAVLCKDCPQRMVAECITLGFSIHQPHKLDTACIYMGQLLTSPLVLAVMRGLPAVTQMLYEAGEYSNRQIRELNIRLFRPTKPNTGIGRDFQREFSYAWKTVQNRGNRDPDYSFDAELMEQSADYLRQVSSTPRSLVSTCRLVISRCLTLSKTRHTDIAQLPLSPMMKNYLMFSDLTDPRYPDLSYRS